MRGRWVRETGRLRPPCYAEIRIERRLPGSPPMALRDVLLRDPFEEPDPGFVRFSGL